MKHHKQLSAMRLTAAALLFALLLSACGGTSQTNTPGAEVTTPGAEVTASPVPAESAKPGSAADNSTSGSPEQDTVAAAAAQVSVSVEKLEQDGADVEYLVVSGLSDADAQTRLNEELRTFYTWPLVGREADDLGFSVTAEYAIVGGRYLSVRAYSYFEGGAHPVSGIASQIYDLHTGDQAGSLADFINTESLPDLIETLVQTFLDADADLAELAELAREEFTDAFVTQYSPMRFESRFYLTESAIGLYVTDLPHVVGDYIALEANYRDASGYMTPRLIVASGVVYSDEMIYSAAVADAKNVRFDEIKPLVCLTRDDPMTSWNDRGQVLLLTLHSYPDSYIAGQDYVTSYGEVWTFTDKEISAWYRGNSAGVDDWTLRLKELVGVPAGRAYTHVSAMWTNPSDVKRPAFEPDVTKQLTELGLTPQADADAAYAEWFAGNAQWSYTDSAYPWTRLGYTYDWAGISGTAYGLSEFLIAKNATVTVEFTKTVDEFVAWLSSAE